VFGPKKEAGVHCQRSKLKDARGCRRVYDSREILYDCAVSQISLFRGLLMKHQYLLGESASPELQRWDEIKRVCSDYVQGRVSPIRMTGLIERDMDIVRRDAARTLLAVYGNPPYLRTHLAHVADRYSLVVENEDSRTGDKRSSLAGARRQLNDLIRRSVNETLFDSSLLISYWYTRHIFRHLTPEFGLPKLRSLADWAAFRVVEWFEDAGAPKREKQLLSMCSLGANAASEAMRRGATHLRVSGAHYSAVAASMHNAAEICAESGGWTETAVQYLFERQGRETVHDRDPEVFDAWAFVTLVKYLARKLWQWDVTARLSVSEPEGRILLRVGSDETFPGEGTPTRRTIPGRSRLAAGAAVAVQAPLFDDNPTPKTHTNYQEECPTQCVVVPLPLSNALGYLYVAIRAPNAEPSVKQPEVKAVLLCLADRARAILDASSEIIPWTSSLKEVRSPNELSREINDRVQRCQEEWNQQRTVYHIVAGHSTTDDDRVASVVEDPAKERALYVSGEEPVYALPVPGWYVVPKRMTEPQWQRHRDGIGRPISVYEAAAEEPCKASGWVAEDNVTWQSDDMMEARNSWGPEKLAATISEAVENTARHIMDIASLRASSRSGNYQGALSYASDVYDRVGPVCASVSNDVSRLSLLCGYVDRSIRCAELRYKSAPWELTVHANLLLGHASNGDVAWAWRHLDHCERCNCYDTGVSATRLLNVNPMLLATIAICLMARLTTPNQSYFWQGEFSYALEKLAPDREMERNTIRSHITEALTLPSSGFSEVTYRQLSDDLWMLNRIREPRAWRQREMLQRLTLGARGVYLATHQPDTETVLVIPVRSEELEVVPETADRRDEDQSTEG
jgi:hypothetical protein